MTDLRVLALTRYPRRGASSRVRFLQFLPHLAARGIAVDVSPLVGERYLRDLYGGRGRSMAEVLRAYGRRLARLRSLGQYDLVWLEKELFPWIPAWVERSLLSGRRPFIVDFDDAIFHRYDQQPSAVLRTLYAGKIGEVMRRAAAVTVGNGYLADYARRAGARRVELIPSCVEVERYEAAPSAPADGDDRFRIGWIGTPSSLRYLRTVRDPLARFCGDHHAKLVLIGTPDMALDGVPTETREWSEDTEVRDLAGIDVGIMPLAPGPWALGKCGYKLIQYMASAKPVIASPVGASRDIVTHGVNGFLAASPGEWSACLQTLHADRGRAAAMGRAGLALVKREYSVSARAAELGDLFAALTGA